MNMKIVYTYSARKDLWNLDGLICLAPALLYS